MYEAAEPPKGSFMPKGTGLAGSGAADPRCGLPDPRCSFSYCAEEGERVQDHSLGPQTALCSLPFKLGCCSFQRP